MHATLFPNYATAVETVRRNLSPRALELDTLERYVAGAQYEGRADYFDEQSPLWERAPCVVYTLAHSAIESHRDLVLGEGRFPAITSNPGEDSGDEGGLDIEASKNVDRAIAMLCKRARFRAVMRQALEKAMASKSVAVIMGVRDGRPFLEYEPAKWCTPTLDAAGNCLRLEIRYPYLHEDKQVDGTWKLIPRLYRRVIDDQADTTFLPIDADPSGRDPLESQWKVDPARTVAAHGLGFCPVRWYAHLKDNSTVGHVDGHAIHEKQLDEIRGLDFALSQRFRLAIFAGSPPIIETGTESGPRAETGTQTAIPATIEGGPVEKGARTAHVYQSTQGKTARKVSPGAVWSYAEEKVSVAYLSLPPGNAEILDSEVADLRNKLCEAFAYVPTDVENVKYANAMSGKAIEALRGRQFDRCDTIRDDVEQNLLLPVVQMLLRIALMKGVKSRALQAARAQLEAILQDGDDPTLYVRWPKGYIKPAPDEQQMIVTFVALAYEKNLITLRTAVQALQQIFAIDNVDEAVEVLEAEIEKRRQKAQEDMQATADAQPPGAVEPNAQTPQKSVGEAA